MPATSSAREGKRPARAGGAGRVPERRCLVSRASFPVDRLVRFVIGPDGAVVPDIEGRLPGRGLWLRARRDIIDRACATHAFARGAKARVHADGALADRVERSLARRCLDLLGLARRAGAAVAGFERAAALARSGRAGLLLVAGDGAANGRARFTGADPVVPVVDLFSGAELGAVFGRELTVYAAVAEGGLTGRLAVECDRLAGFRPAAAPSRTMDES